MAMRRIDLSAALRKPGAPRKYFGLQWRMFAAFGLSDEPLYSSRLASCGLTLILVVCEADRAKLRVRQFQWLSVSDSEALKGTGSALLNCSKSEDQPL